MIIVDRRKLYRGFIFAGWLNTQTGDIVECNTMEMPDGTVRYFIDPKISREREKYVRLPCINSVHALVEFIKVSNIEKNDLEDHGIYISMFDNQPTTTQPCYDGFPEYTEQEHDFMSRATQLIEDRQLDDEMDAFLGKEYDIAIIADWCTDYGLSHEGDWDWTNPGQLEVLMSHLEGTRNTSL